MTDDQAGKDDDSTPDGFVIVHHPVDGSASYGIGPFPPLDGLPERLIATGACDCRKEALPIAFPIGVTMLVRGFSFDMDMDEVMEIAREVVDAILPKPEKGRPHDDRLN